MKKVLKKLGRDLGYKHTYHWLVDFIWWDIQSQSLGMAVEFEWSPLVKGEEDDFQKLTVFKCPPQAVCIQCNGRPEDKSMAERSLELRTQHVKNEEYLLIGFHVQGKSTVFFVQSSIQWEVEAGFDFRRCTEAD